MIAWPRKLSGQAAAREAPPVQPEMPRSTWEQRGQYVFFEGVWGRQKPSGMCWRILKLRMKVQLKGSNGIKQHNSKQKLFL